MKLFLVTASTYFPKKKFPKISFCHKMIENYSSQVNLPKNFLSKKLKVDAKYLKFVFAFKNKIWKIVKSFEASSHTEMAYKNLEFQLFLYLGTLHSLRDVILLFLLKYKTMFKKRTGHISLCKHFDLVTAGLLFTYIHVHTFNQSIIGLTSIK